jgi:RNA polymerase sigma-70 factor (ECF subfamily)
MDHLTSQELLDLARHGDRAALNALVRRWYRLVSGLLLRFSRDQALAQDLAQDVFVVFCRREPFQKLDMQQLVPWLRTTARNVWLHYVNNPRQRRGCHLSDGELDNLPAREPNSSDRAEQEDLAARFWLYIRDLPASYQQVMMLRVEEGLTFEQMSKRLDVAAGTLRWWASQARSMLLARIAAADPDLFAWIDRGGQDARSE